MKTRGIVAIAAITGFALISQSCLREENLNQAFKTHEPVDISDGLILSDPASENVNGDALTEVYLDLHDDAQFWQFRSLLVFRNGRLISESYMKDDADRTRRHLIWSCTKQYIGVLVGIALEQGMIEDINDPLARYLPEAAEHGKENISIRNLLMMHSGIEYSNDGVEGQTDKVLRQIPDDITEFVLSRPSYADPGTDFNYNDGDPQLLSAMLQKIAGKPADEWADEVLFNGLGFENYNWVRYRDGITLGGFGIETTPRELSKLALCVADSGQYNGNQLIPKSWLKEMLQPYTHYKDEYSFGYQWWMDTSRNISFMAGHGGQYACIIPDYDLLVVCTAIPNTQGNKQINFPDLEPILDRIIAGCR